MMILIFFNGAPVISYHSDSSLILSVSHSLKDRNYDIEENDETRFFKKPIKSDTICTLEKYHITPTH